MSTIAFGGLLIGVTTAAINGKKMQNVDGMMLCQVFEGSGITGERPVTESSGVDRHSPVRLEETNWETPFFDARKAPGRFAQVSCARGKLSGT